MPSVLALGLDPGFADYSQMPELTPQAVRSFIDAQLERVREAGYEVESCLVDTGATAEATPDCATARTCCCSNDCSTWSTARRPGRSCASTPGRAIRWTRCAGGFRAELPQARGCCRKLPAPSGQCAKGRVGEPAGSASLA
jgi:hypothetical protein